MENDLCVVDEKSIYLYACTSRIWNMSIQNTIPCSGKITNQHTDEMNDTE
jgi:hypothetical protein